MSTKQREPRRGLRRVSRAAEGRVLSVNAGPEDERRESRSRARSEVRDRSFVHMRWTNTVRNFVLWALDRALGARIGNALRCTGCHAEGVSCDTDEMSTEYARANPTSNSTICDVPHHQGHHVSANTELRAGTVKVRRPRGSGVGAQRRTSTAPSTAPHSIA